MKSFPSAQTILLIIIAFVAFLTWLIPAGKFDTLGYDTEKDRFIKISQGIATEMTASQDLLDSMGIRVPLEKFTSGSIYKPIAIPGSYEKVQSNPQGVVELIKAPIKGIIEAADIIFLVLIIGGLIGIMNRVGAFNAGIAALVNLLEGKEYLLIVFTTSLVALGGTTFGFAEETIAFFPILIPVFILAGYDAMVAIACIFLGSAIGTMCSTINPFSSIIASDAAGISWTTGIEGRTLMFILCLLAAIMYILRYARKVKSDPSRSVVFDQKEELESLFSLNDVSDPGKMSIRMKLVLVLFGLSFLIMVVGVSMLDWWFVEMTTTFFVASILIAIIARMKESEVVDSFCSGAADLLGVAFIIGIARGSYIIMSEGLISDTLLYQMSLLTDGLNKGVFINALFVLYNGLSFFIPSSSGMAVLSMPVIAPLADTVDIGREHIVNAYQYGMGVFYIINPTGLILASLAVAKIGFDRWVKFIWPFFIILVIITMLFLSISVYL